MNHLTTGHCTLGQSLSPVFFFLPSLAPGDSHSVFVSLAFMNSTYKQDHIVFVLIDFTSVRTQGQSMLLQKERFPFFSRLDNTLLIC